MSAGGRLVPLTGAGWEDDAPGIRARAIEGVDGRRFAIVEYGPGAAREDWCLDGHYGMVLEGEIEYWFEDGEPTASDRSRRRVVARRRRPGAPGPQRRGRRDHAVLD